MQSIGQIINNKYHSFNDKLEYDFNKAMEEEKFNKVVSGLKTSKQEIMKHTTQIEETVKELNNCSKCKNLLMCKNTVAGHVYYPTVENDKVIMCYIPCKYQKQMDKNNAYYKIYLIIVLLNTIFTLIEALTNVTFCLMAKKSNENSEKNE